MVSRNRNEYLSILLKLIIHYFRTKKKHASVKRPVSKGLIMLLRTFISILTVTQIFRRQHWIDFMLLYYLIVFIVWIFPNNHLFLHFAILLNNGMFSYLCFVDVNDIAYFILCFKGLKRWMTTPSGWDTFLQSWLRQSWNRFFVEGWSSSLKE